MFYTAGAGGHYLAVLPAEEVVVVVRADTYTAKHLRIRDGLIERILEAKVAKATLHPKLVPLQTSEQRWVTFELDPDQRKKFVGKYKGQYINSASSDAQNDTFYIVESEDELMLERYEYFYHFKLFPLTTNRFYVEDLELLLVFDSDDKGRPVNPVFYKSKTTEHLHHKILGEGMESAFSYFGKAKENIADEFELRFLAHHFESIGKTSESIELLRWNVIRFPGSVDCHRNFINKYSEHEDLRVLTRTYEQTIAQSNRGRETHQIVQWYSQWLRARAYPAVLSDTERSRYVGVYGPRHIVYEDGDLYYYRDDRAGVTKYRLLKVAENVFILDDRFADGFRIQFVVGEDGKATKIVGIYIDGRQDESLRSDIGSEMDRER
jgi:hypothetical protein